VPDGGGCIKPHHTRHDRNGGGPHTKSASETCVADGGMNGFVQSYVDGVGKVCKSVVDPACSPGKAEDVMSYHDDREIPNYWAYAKAFALQDHMFAPTSSYSLPSHLYMVSAWSAFCTPADDPTACKDAPWNPGDGHHLSVSSHHFKAPAPEYAWTDITFLLHKSGVSWRYYVEGGNQPDCVDGEMLCEAGVQDHTIPSYWNVLPWFDDVVADKEVSNVADTNDFFRDLKAGKMAQVSWFVPSYALSEHPTAAVSHGQAYVTQIVNAIMSSPFWKDTVIFISWDDWGGYYDHVVPVKVDAQGYGIRVPGLTISPWVKPHVVDHGVYSHDAYLRFIEDLFLNGARLDPKTDGRKDDRKMVREDAPELGDLLDEFDFTQPPNPPLVLEPCPTGVDTLFGKRGPCVVPFRP
jgi:phospholipase C